MCSHCGQWALPSETSCRTYCNGYKPAAAQQASDEVLPALVLADPLLPQTKRKGPEFRGLVPGEVDDPKSSAHVEVQDPVAPEGPPPQNVGSR